MLSCLDRSMLRTMARQRGPDLSHGEVTLAVIDAPPMRQPESDFYTTTQAIYFSYYMLLAPLISLISLAMVWVCSSVRQLA